MSRKAFTMPSLPSLLTLFVLVSLCVFVRDGEACRKENEDDVFGGGMRPSMVKKGHRKSLVVTEYGEISAVDICSERKGGYHLEFMTLEPNALFLPVALHADMVFYVNTGSGKLSWAEDGREMKRVNIRRGDIYRLPAGSVFFMQSNLEPERQKLRIYAIYSNTDEDLYEPYIGAYSSISDLVLGFDRKLLQSAFKVSGDVIEEMASAMRPPAIVHAMPEEKKSILKEIEARFLNVLIGNKDGDFYGVNGHKKKKTKIFNILDANPDFENCNGWSVTVGRGDLKSLRGSNIGVFMVNLTKGSMMGPHWNPMASEIAIVLQGRGMVKVVCSSNANEADCKNMRFKVEEGDVFAVPRFHPMAQMSFNNDSFVFMGFSTSTRKNYPQFLAGKSSVLQTLDKDILALSFNVTNTTIHELLAPQEEAIILDCTSCAEEEQTVMEQEMEKERQEEEARKKEEEREREEEEREREEEKRREEEEAKREQEEAREREEEREKREREEMERRERERKEEEEEREREEERRRQEEEAEREQEEAREREEERQRREREEMEKREREQKEAEKREEEERERREEEEERRRQEEEAEREQEEAREREEERQRREREEMERREREQKEAEKREEEERERREEEARREQEEARGQEEERQKREREEMERREREQKEAEKRQEEERERREAAARREQEESRRQEEERQERQRQEEEEARRQREKEEEGGEEEHEGGGGEGEKAPRKVWNWKF